VVLQPDMDKTIVVVGSLNMDLVVRSTQLPLPGETIIGSDFRTFPGGKGANQAVAAARLGARVKMIGRVGKDPFGDSLMQTLAKDGIDASFVGRDPQAATGVALITVDAGGQNTIVVASGANGQVTPQDILQAESAFAGSAVLLLQLEIPLQAIEKAIELARKHHLQVVLNPAPAQPLAKELLAGVDTLIPNQTELRLLTGMDEIQPAAHRLLEMGVRQVVVTLGEQGALVCGEGGEFTLPAYRVEAVDATAAGDAFVGAYAVALLEGESPIQAARRGNAAGALAVTRQGAQPSLPTREELDNFVSSQTVDRNRG
jgi:ribokinase